jgi:hypothetical protein
MAQRIAVTEVRCKSAVVNQLEQTWQRKRLDLVQAANDLRGLVLPEIVDLPLLELRLPRRKPRAAILLLDDLSLQPQLLLKPCESLDIAFQTPSRYEFPQVRLGTDTR